MSGTRRKARECALQILFAADLIDTPPKDLARDYWGEFGFDELHSGANKLVASFIDQLDKIQASIDEVKNSCKKLSSLGAITTFTKESKELTVRVNEIRKSYTVYIGKFVADQSPGELEVAPVIESLGQDFRFHTNSIRTHLSGKGGVTKAERDRVNDFIKSADEAIVTLAAKTVPEVQKLLVDLQPSREFGSKLAIGALENLKTVDERIKTRAEHWRIERMALVDRNILRLAVYEFLYEDTPHTVVINEALEIARRFSTFEATQFINGILDAIKQDLEKAAQEV